MALIDFLILLIIAGICGSLAQALTGYSHGGCLISIVLGFIGAVLGTWMAETLGFPKVIALPIGSSGEFPIIWSIIGAALFSAVLSLLPRKQVRA